MKFRLWRVHLDRDGYERGCGTYYGLGQPIFRACSDDRDGTEMEFRASCRDAAKGYVRQNFDKFATFYR